MDADRRWHPRAGGVGVPPAERAVEAAGQRLLFGRCLDPLPRQRRRRLDPELGLWHGLAGRRPGHQPDAQHGQQRGVLCRDRQRGRHRAGHHALDDLQHRALGPEHGAGDVVELPGYCGPPPAGPALLRQPVHVHGGRRSAPVLGRDRRSTDAHQLRHRRRRGRPGRHDEAVPDHERRHGQHRLHARDREPARQRHRDHRPRRCRRPRAGRSDSARAPFLRRHARPVP